MKLPRDVSGRELVQALSKFGYTIIAKPEVIFGSPLKTTGNITSRSQTMNLYASKPLLRF